MLGSPAAPSVAQRGCSTPWTPREQSRVTGAGVSKKPSSTSRQGIWHGDARCFTMNMVLACERRPVVNATNEIAQLALARDAMKKRRGAIESLLDSWSAAQAVDAVIEMSRNTKADRASILTTSFWLEQVFERCSQKYPRESESFATVRTLLSQFTASLAGHPNATEEHLERLRADLIFESIAARSAA